MPETITELVKTIPTLRELTKNEMENLDKEYKVEWPDFVQIVPETRLDLVEFVQKLVTLIKGQETP